MAKRIPTESDPRPAPPVRRLPVDAIAPNPRQPRENFAADALAELAESIRAQGILQPLIVRSRPDPALAAVDAVTWELVAGERRLRAARLAGLAEVPVIDRSDLTDADAQALAITENLHREGLDVIEEARGLRALVELGRSQVEIAKGLGKSEGWVSNRLRILELPDDVQALVRAGELTAAHVVALARFKQWPAVVGELARVAADQNWPSATLERGVLPGAEYLARSGVVQRIWPHLARFDYKAVCARCPFGAYLATPDSPELGGYCLRPAHYRELEEQATAAAAERARAERERARDAARAATVGGAASPTPAETPAPGPADRPPEGTLRVPRSAPPIVDPVGASVGWPGSVPDPNAPPATPEPARLASMHEGIDYCAVSSDKPSACTESCACRGAGRNYRGDVVPICLKPTRYRYLAGQDTRTRNEHRRKVLERRLKRIQERLDALGGVGADELALLAVVAFRWVESHATYNDPKLPGMADRYPGLPLPGGEPFRAAPRIGDQRRLGNLAGRGALELARCAVEAILRRDALDAYADSPSHGGWARWYAGEGAGDDDALDLAPTLVETLGGGAPDPVAEQPAVADPDARPDDHSTPAGGPGERCRLCGRSAAEIVAAGGRWADGDVFTADGLCLDCDEGADVFVERCRLCGRTEPELEAAEEDWADAGLCLACSQAMGDDAGAPADGPPEGTLRAPRSDPPTGPLPWTGASVVDAPKRKRGRPRASAST